MTLEERAKAILIAHDCPPGHRAIAAMLQMAAEERERAAQVADSLAEQEEFTEGWLAADGVAIAIRNMEQGQ